MAALMQQLFMCPRLADGLLAADAANAGNNQSEMLRELQLLLASLRHSSSAAWSPHGFCAAFRVCSLWLEAESFTAESFTRALIEPCSRPVLRRTSMGSRYTRSSSETLTSSSTSCSRCVISP